MRLTIGNSVLSFIKGTLLTAAINNAAFKIGGTMVSYLTIIGTL